jgi:hypothetical protein
MQGGKESKNLLPGLFGSVSHCHQFQVTQAVFRQQRIVFSPAVVGLRVKLKHFFVRLGAKK